MAKSKKMGALPIMEIGGALAGAIASGLVKKTLEKSAPELDPKIKSAIITAGGAFLAMQKNPLLKGAGLAMVSVGGYDLVTAFLPASVSGIEDVFMSAPADQSILSAPADQSILSGGDDYMGEDYSINGDDYMGEDYSINGDDYMGEDYSINGDNEI
jgi:hypothetical protein